MATLRLFTVELLSSRLSQAPAPVGWGEGQEMQLPPQKELDTQRQSAMGQQPHGPLAARFQLLKDPLEEDPGSTPATAGRAAPGSHLPLPGWTGPAFLLNESVCKSDLSAKLR